MFTIMSPAARALKCRHPIWRMHAHHDHRMSLLHAAQVG
jgi:hypothetical protein